MLVERLREISKDLTARRVYDAIDRRFRDLPHWLAWNRPGPERERNQARLRRYAGRHAGGRCFIMGNGPSLGRMDLRPLRDEITFGMNRIYLLRDQIGFLPTYFACSNELVLEQFAGDIRALPMPKFLNWDRRHLFDADDEQTLFFRMPLALSDPFRSDPYAALSSGGTVTYVALQLAFFMGFTEVILIGVDHNFVDKGTPNKTEVRTQARDDNHFAPNYFPTGSRWQLPDLPRSELAYAAAREAFERAGRRVIDATAGGKCTIFEKRDFADVVAS